MKAAGPTLKIMKLALAAAVLAATIGSPAQAGSLGATAIDERTGPPTITVSKAGDGLGAPIELRAVSDTRGATVTGSPNLDRLPIAGRLTSRFGLRYHPILGGSRQHSGVDLAAPAGSPVRASADGIVSFADWRGGYGNMIAIEHGSGLQTRFAHLSRIAVRAGQRVTKGQLIGLVGSTGRSTGPHLHYEVRQNGSAVDPLRVR